MNHHQSHHSNGCSFNPTYNFGYDQVGRVTPTSKELEVELDPAAGNYSGNYSSSSSGSPSSNSMGAFERSISSLSLTNPCKPPPPPPPATNYEDNIYSQLDAPFRRVYSAGELDSVNSYMAARRRRSEQRTEESSTSLNETNLIIQGCILTASKYSPEQKKERIERYKYKRNQRNFHKKIQYTCRKTLADSRPRLKGRFVRNDELPSAATATATAQEENSYNVDTASTSCWYQGGAYSAFNHEYSISNSHHQHAHAYDNVVNVGGEEENSWIELLDCSFPFPTSNYNSST